MRFIHFILSILVFFIYDFIEHKCDFCLEHLGNPREKKINSFEAV